jgi:hypothetical protein
MKTRFLWIEDNAVTDLKNLLSPIYTSGKYEPVFALNITDGVKYLNKYEFDAVIVDIRVPPGDSLQWQNVSKKWGGNKAAARLGLHLLTCLFDPHEGDEELVVRPAWLTPDKVGVLTVDSELERESVDDMELSDYLRALNINVYRRKSAMTPINVLLKMVEEIVSS